MYPPIIKYNHAITDSALLKEYCENSMISIPKDVLI
jgi:hypothetical protein